MPRFVTNTLCHNDPDLNAALQEQLAVRIAPHSGLSHSAGCSGTGPASLDRSGTQVLTACFFSEQIQCTEIVKVLHQYCSERRSTEAPETIIGMEVLPREIRLVRMAAKARGRFHERFSEWFWDNWHLRLHVAIALPERFCMRMLPIACNAWKTICNRRPNVSLAPQSGTL